MESEIIFFNEIAAAAADRHGNDDDGGDVFRVTE